MAEPVAVEPVKVIVGVLWSDERCWKSAIESLEDCFGPIDFKGPPRPFDATRYYDDEMGPSIVRQFVSHERLVGPSFLSRAKHETNRIEEEQRVDGRRRVNLDVGYLDLHKLVLASMKPAGQKIYLTDGVYADLTARFAQGRYQPFEWTFPDLRDGRYDEELLQIRDLLRQVRRRGSGSS